MGRLTALAARALSRPGRHGDGDGLYLHVAPAGSKSWVQRIVVDGRRRDIGLGPYPTVSLARARAIAHDNRTAVAAGRDPVAEKREARGDGPQACPVHPHLRRSRRPGDRAPPPDLEQRQARRPVGEDAGHLRPSRDRG